MRAGANAGSGVGAITCGDSGTPDVVGPVSGGHTCALGREDEQVVCWGSGGGGQLGDGELAASTTPVAPKDLGAAVSVSAGGESVGGDKGHTCAALVDGTVACWGSGWAGQLGDGLEQQSAVPTAVAGIDSAVDVVTGSLHSCALLLDRTVVVCWGHDYHGQLGSGGHIPSATPTPVVGIEDVVTLAAGMYHSCALVVGGSLRCWGLGDMGQLGNGTTKSSPSPVTPSGF